jgi:hypothetical protein
LVLLLHLDFQLQLSPDHLVFLFPEADQEQALHFLPPATPYFPQAAVLQLAVQISAGAGPPQQLTLPLLANSHAVRAVCLVSVHRSCSLQLSCSSPGAGLGVRPLLGWWRWHPAAALHVMLNAGMVEA